MRKKKKKWRNFTSHYSRLFNTNQLDFNYHMNLIIIWLRGANRLKQGLNSGFEKTSLHKRMNSFCKLNSESCDDSETKKDV